MRASVRTAGIPCVSWQDSSYQSCILHRIIPVVLKPSSKGTARIVVENVRSIFDAHRTISEPTVTVKNRIWRLRIYAGGNGRHAGI
jgi:hypothetical protein